MHWFVLDNECGRLWKFTAYKMHLCSHSVSVLLKFVWTRFRRLFFFLDGCVQFFLVYRNNLPNTRSSRRAFDDCHASYWLLIPSNSVNVPFLIKFPYWFCEIFFHGWITEIRTKRALFLELSISKSNLEPVQTYKKRHLRRELHTLMIEWFAHSY